MNSKWNEKYNRFLNYELKNIDDILATINDSLIFKKINEKNLNYLSEIQLLALLYIWKNNYLDHLVEDELMAKNNYNLLIKKLNS